MVWGSWLVKGFGANGPYKMTEMTKGPLTVVRNF